MGRVQLGELVDQYPHRPAVSNNMVQGQHQHMIVGVQLQQADSQQRAVLQIKRPGYIQLQQLHGHVQAFGLGLITQIMLGQSQ